MSWALSMGPYTCLLPLVLLRSIGVWLFVCTLRVQVPRRPMLGRLTAL